MASVLTFSQDEKDLAESQKILLTGTVDLNTNGISPVPAFSLDKP
jgi:hypothetical protein